MESRRRRQICWGKKEKEKKKERRPSIAQSRRVLGEAAGDHTGSLAFRCTKISVVPFRSSLSTVGQETSRSTIGPRVSGRSVKMSKREGG